MKRYIAFVLSALMCTNLCACGANPQLEPIEEEPAAPIVQEVVVPVEPVVQEVSAPKENLSVSYMGKIVENGGTLYVNEEAFNLTVQQGRKKLKEYQVNNSNPTALEYSVDENGILDLKTVEKGSSTLTLSTENTELSFTVETRKKITIKTDNAIIEPNASLIMGVNSTQIVKVLVDGEEIKDFVVSSKDLYPGATTPTMGRYRKTDDGAILFEAAFKGTCAFSITVHGMTENFVLSIGKKQGNQQNNQQGNQATENIQPAKAPIVRQIDYDPIIDQYRIPAGLGTPKYSVDEIKQMIDDNLTLDEVAEKISNVADLVQYLHQKGYSSGGEDIQFKWNNYRWHVNLNAKSVFKQNIGNCGGGSNMVNYILKGDYDAQGYVKESHNQGGHIYNYFLENGTYYFMDLVQITHDGKYDRTDYQIYVTASPQSFSDYMVSRSHKRSSESDSNYLLMLFMYQSNDSHIAASDHDRKKLSTATGYPLLNSVLPKEYKDKIKILYLHEDYPEPTFVAGPPKSEWPKEAR